LTEQALPENGYFRLDDYYIDVGDHKIFHADTARHLEPKAMQVLYQLALSAGETVSRNELMDKVWHGRVVIDDSLTRVISQLRQHFNDSKTRKVIQTVPKKGYRLSANVTWLTRQEFINRGAMQSTDDFTVDPDISDKPKLVNAPTLNKGKAVAFAVFSVILTLLIYFFLPDVLQSPESFIERSHTNGNRSTPTTVAFLPWRNLTGDANNDYLAEMLPEELSITLAKSDKISVLSHYSSVALARNPTALEALLDDVNIEYWVEGSVTQANERIRVLVRLVEKQSNNAIWSQIYEDDMQQLLILNTKVIADINTQLFGQSEPATFIVAANNIDINAYQAYLQGNYWWMNGTTSEWFSRAEASFARATELAPNFASAFGSLAFVYARYNYHDIYMEKTVALAKANAAINSALQLDANDTNALLAGAILAIEDLRFDTAQQLINRVLSVDALNTRGLYVYSELALAKNEFDVALRYAEKALQLDPLSPWINVNKAIVHFWRNEMPEALALVERAIDIDSNYTWAYVYKAKILRQQSQITAAIDAMNICLTIDTGSPVNSIFLALLYDEANMPSQAQDWFSYTASLYGDSPDARFWQSYLSFINQQEDSDITRALVDQLTLKTTRFFSVVPLQKALLSLQPALIEQSLTEFLAPVELPDKSGFWVNHRNQFSAYAASALMQQLNSAEYEQKLAELNTQIEVFESKVAPLLRAEIK